MTPTTLDPSELAVESFEIGAPSEYRIPPTTMRTFEPGCTTPELCGMDPIAP